MKSVKFVVTKVYSKDLQNYEFIQLHYVIYKTFVKIFANVLYKTYSGILKCP